MKGIPNSRYFIFATVKNVRAIFLGNLYRMNFSSNNSSKIKSYGNSMKNCSF
ncbi:hypothetical protein LEP1GSC079_2320 [Leptospira interrogans str. FPW1039]|uniref:Uncharacterized protein n=1 Tax=Leptospira interrogans str. FPW1039 TaxID=1193040 RepID=A0A0F6IIN9_LEPIR|nr:hypothetical protein LEP1GSC079_2320 [Leptospira interrogans str. FPW1039]